MCSEGTTDKNGCSWSVQVLATFSDSLVLGIVSKGNWEIRLKPSFIQYMELRFDIFLRSCTSLSTFHEIKSLDESSLLRHKA